MEFTWASVVKSDKVTVQQEEERLAQRSKQEREREQAAALRLAARGRPTSASSNRLGPIHHHEVRLTETDVTDMRAQGFWINEISNTSGFQQELPVPQNVNARALEFIERVVINWPEWQHTCDTVGKLRQGFHTAYAIHVKTQYRNLLRTFEEWHAIHCYKSNEASYTEPADLYNTLQMWVAFKEKNEANPWRNALWIFAKNVTFENCLWALNVESKTFASVNSGSDPVLVQPVLVQPGLVQPGLVQLLTPIVNDLTPIKWLQDLHNYRFTAIAHAPKPPCKEKLERRRLLAMVDEWD